MLLQKSMCTPQREAVSWLALQKNADDKNSWARMMTMTTTNINSPNKCNFQTNQQNKTVP